MSNILMEDGMIEFLYRFSQQFGILNHRPEGKTSKSGFRLCVESFRVFCASLSTEFPYKD